MSSPWRGKRGYSAVVSSILLVASLLSPAPAAAQGDSYVAAYNTLASNLNRRSAIAGGTTFAAKDPALGQTVTGGDLDLMRSRIRTLMASSFLMPVGSTSPATNAFPAGLRYANGTIVKPSLMDGIGDGQGRFTKIPGEYTASGAAIYAESFGDAPLLWIHFQELDAAIRTLQHTAAGGQWDTAGPNHRGGWSGHVPTNKFADALAICEDSYDRGAATNNAGGPHAWFSVTGPYQGHDYDLTLSRQVAAYRVTKLHTGTPHSVSFYIIGTAPTSCPPAYVTTFDANGDNLSTNLWRRWDSSGETSESNAVSRTFGALDMPARCGDPGSNNYAWVGYWADARCVASWKFSDTAIYRPKVVDSSEDGLADIGCDCGDCPLEAKLACSGGRADATIRIPLGITSGINTAGLRLKAYMTEYEMNGIIRQMYSLFTTVTCAWDNPTEGWSFLSIKRPSGAEVLMATTGKEAGKPVNVKANYRVKRNGNIVELRFPGKTGSGDIIHSFLLNYPRIWETLSVAMVSGTNRVYVTGTQYKWPGMTVDFPGGDPPQWRQIASVSSPGLVAIPTYMDGLIRNVEYRYTGMTNRIEHYTGSTGFRSFMNGKLISDARLVRDPGGGAVEIWSGITTNFGLRVARKEIRREWREPDTGQLKMCQMTLLNEGTPQAESNATLTVYEEFPWGEEIVSETEGAGTAAERTTTFGYGTDPADSNAWAQLAWQRDPHGGWTRYEYDAAGRETAILTPFKSSSFDATNECRRTVLLYGGEPALTGLNFPTTDQSATDDRPRAEIRFIAGRETARTYWSYQAETQIMVRCAQTGALFDATGNVRTVTRYVATGTYKNRPAEIENPDGTRSVFSYSSTGGLTMTEDSGSGPAGSVTSGVRRVTVRDSAERVSEESSRDIATAALLSRTVNTRDGLGRVLCASNTVTGAATTHQLGCCGPEDTLDSDGIRTLTVYDELKLVYATERNGVTVFTRRDVLGNTIETRQSAAGLPDVVRSNAYDSAGRQVSATDERGFTTQWLYSTNSLGEPVVTVIYPDGSTRTETSFLDGQVKCAVMQSDISSQRSLERNALAFRPARQSAPLQEDGTAVCYDYGADENGTFAIEYRGPDTNAAEWVKTCADRLGRATRVIHPDGYTTETLYDPAGRPCAQTDGLTTRLTEYNARGEPEWTAADMNGNGTLDRSGPDRVTRVTETYGLISGKAARKTSTFVCDQDGSEAARVVSEQWTALDGQTSWSIAFGRTTRVDIVRFPAAAARTETATYPDGTRTVSCHTNGLLKSVSRLSTNNAVVSVVRYDYDAFDRLCLADEPAPSGQRRETRFDRDAAGNVTNETVTAGGVTRATASDYDAAGRRVTVVRPDGGIVRSEYEPGGRLVAVSGAGVYPVRYGYDAQGRLDRLETFRNGATGAPDLTRWLYDSRRGWLAAKVQADGTTNRFEYRGDGKLARRISARGIATEYRYDAGGTLTNIVYSDNTPAVALRPDRLDRVKEVSDAGGVRAIRYSDDGQTAAEEWPLAGLQTGIEYDAHGRRKGLTVSSLGGGPDLYRVDYRYDNVGRLGSVSNAGWTADYAFGPDGQTVSRLTYRTGSVETVRGEWRRDGFGLVTNLAWTAGGEVVDGFAYQGNVMGQRTQCARADGSRWDYAYDALDQIRTASQVASNGTTAASRAYAYDSIGNRQTATSDGRDTTYQVNALNQYEQIAAQPEASPVFKGTVIIVGGKLASPAAAQLRYDADGNVTNDGTTAYFWDAENRLTLISNLQSQVSFSYDYLSRRICKSVFDLQSEIWTLESQTKFAYDGWNLISESVVYGLQSNVSWYAWGLDLSGALDGAGGIGGLLSSISCCSSGSMSRFFLYDDNGNVTALLCPSSTTPPSTLHRYSYDPFGNLLPLNPEPSTIPRPPFLFSTKYFDSETGLYYYGYRYYSPALGRWLSRDPLAENGGVNLYGFLRNTPPNAVDALGLALYAFDGTWNDSSVMKRPTNVAKLRDVYRGAKWYEKGVGTDWYTKYIGGATGAGGKNRIEAMYAKLVEYFNTPDPTGENQQIDVIGFSRGAALARTFVNHINSKGGVQLRGLNGKPTRTYCAVNIRFLGLFDTVASFGLPGNNVNFGQDLSIPQNLLNVRHAVALDEKRGMFPLSSVLTDPETPYADPRIIERGFRGAHSDVGGGYEDGDLSNLALMWMHSEAVGVGVPFGPLDPADMIIRNPIIHDERSDRERRRDKMRDIYYLDSGR